MSQIIEVKVPDIGDFSDVPVIDLFVKVGDSIKVDDAIATLESDKATMDVPSTVEGVIKEVLVQLGSKVSEGVVLIKVETGGAAAAAAPAAQAAAPAPTPAATPAAAPPAAGGGVVEVKVPDIGDFSDVPVIDLFVKSATASRSTTPSPRSNPTRRPWTCRPPPPAWSRKCWSSSAPRSAKASC